MPRNVHEPRRSPRRRPPWIVTALLLWTIAGAAACAPTVETTTPTTVSASSKSNGNKTSTTAGKRSSTTARGDRDSTDSTDSSESSEPSESTESTEHRSDDGGGSGPPTGEYQCYQYSAASGYLYFGKLRIDSADHYTPTPGDGGTFSMSADGAITFESGTYADSGWAGQYHAPDGKDFKSETIVVDPGSLKISCHA